MEQEFFFRGWEPIIRMVVIGTCSYVALLILLRVSGKRTLSRFTAFDLVITMALGSILGKILVDEDLSLAESITALSLLIALNVITAWLEMRFPRFCHLINSPPTVLYRQGQYRHDAMRRELITQEEIEAAACEKGIGDMSKVESVILGTNGQLSILVKTDAPRPQVQAPAAD